MKAILLACIWVSQVAPLLAQKTDTQLTATILHRDSLFWQAYNTCNISEMRTLFTDDIEFYHDKGGTTLGLDSLIATLQTGLCKDPATYALRREAVPGSVHVYPLHKQGVLYGAIIEGEHVFYIRQPGKDEYIDGQARFNHLWLLRDGEWKMARVLSYDHHAATYVNKRVVISLPEAGLSSYIGKYQGPQSHAVEIVLEDGHLVVILGDKRFTIYAETQDRFFMKERDLTFTFDGGKLAVREHGAIAEELMKQ